MSKSLIGDLDLSHLFGEDRSIEDIADPVKATKVAPDKDPRTKDEWTFSFSYTAPRGETFKGQFTNRILTVYEQSRLATIIARLQDGQPVEAIDPSVRLLNGAIAHMTLSLTAKPDWAANLGALKDIPLIISLWEHVSGHEDCFFRGDIQDPQRDTSV